MPVPPEVTFSLIGHSEPFSPAVRVSVFFPEVTFNLIGHSEGGRARPRDPRRLLRLPRAAGPASVPAGDRARPVGGLNDSSCMVFSFCERWGQFPLHLAARNRYELYSVGI